MNRWLCALAACGALAAPANAQRPATPAFTPAMSAAIDRLGKYAVESGHTPGLAIGVAEEGRIVYARGFGSANLERNVAFDPDTESYLGGVSMQFVAAATLLLQQDGKLKLDDKVVKYLPDFTVAGDATISQLLTQTSGLPDITRLRGFNLDPTHEMKFADLLAAANKMNPSAAPGAAYAPNDLNYMVAAKIVETISGVPLSDYLQQHVFLPLVMDHTFLAGDSGIADTHAVGYTYTPTAPKRFAPVRAWDRTWLYGGRGVVSTIYDLAKWDIEMPILLRVDAVRTMFSASGAPGPTQYGMGWVIDRRGGKLFTWYDGEIAGYRAMNALLPDDHVAVIVLTNADSFHGGHIADPRTIAARILDIVAPPTRANLDNAVVARAKEWLLRLADRQIDRTQLTADFSAYLTDNLVARENFSALGKLQSIVPISSTTAPDGDTLYEFLVRYPHGVQYHYKFGLTKDNKIDHIELAA
jgi:CubicO group peptidase (beta-lactamase class C family)